MSQTVRLAAHGFEAEVWTRGAHMARLVAHRGKAVIPLLHTPEDAAPGATPRWFGSWPMLPLCNRAYGAQLDTGFETHALPVNEGDFNIHGCSWQRDWHLESHRPERVVLSLTEDQFGPYRFHARLSMSLEPHCVAFDLSIRHDGDAPLPYGMGFHPWFPATRQTQLRFKAKQEVHMAPGFRPRSVGAIQPDHDFAQGRVPRWHSGPQEQELAANYLGWDGTAEVIWPEQGHSLTIYASESLANPVVWSPIGADFVCFEPQSQAVGAQTEGLIRARAPLHWLAKGQSLHGAMALQLAPLQPICNP